MVMKVLIADPCSAEGIACLGDVAQVDVKTGLKEQELIDIIGEYEALKRAAIDPYVALRNAYHQNRLSLIND